MCTTAAVFSRTYFANQKLHIGSIVSNRRTSTIFSNQNFHYTHCIAPKRVASLRGPSPRYCARVTQLLSGSTVSNLSGPRFEPQISRSRDEPVTAQATDRNSTISSTSEHTTLNNIIITSPPMSV